MERLCTARTTSSTLPPRRRVRRLQPCSSRMPTISPPRSSSSFPKASSPKWFCYPMRAKAGLSESGLIHLPLGNLYDYPILQPESTNVFLSTDYCSRGSGGVQLKINNLGKGKLTFSVPTADASLITQVATGITPGAIAFMMEPGRTGVTRQSGTNLYSGGGATNSGAPLNLNLA